MFDTISNVWKTPSQDSSITFRQYDKCYGTQLDMHKIKSHINVALSEPEVRSYEDQHMLTAHMEMTRNMGVQVDECVADEIFRMMMARWGAEPKPLVKMECHNCGGSLEIDTNKHIFHCPYCNAVYAVGTNHINSR